MKGGRIYNIAIKLQDGVFLYYLAHFLPASNENNGDRCHVLVVCRSGL